MVRTRASNAAVRKAVVAKAPRKNVTPGRSNIISPNGGASAKKKGKAGGGGGNPLKLWPVPKGQRGLQSFFGGQSSEDGGGCSSSASAEPSGSTDHLDELTEDQLIGEESVSYEEGGGEGSSSSHEEDASCNAATNSNFLDDITQLNSDSDED